MHDSVQKWLMAAGILSILFGSGCGRDSIESYRVPKAWSESAVPTQAHQGAGEIHWVVPEAWSTLAPGNMRVASYQTPEGGDASVTRLPDSPDVENVNRWLGQLGIDPLNEAQVLNIREIVDTEVGSVHLYQLEGDSPDSRSILAAILRMGPQTYFFKLDGIRTVVRDQRENFLALIRSIHLDESLADAGELHSADAPEMAVNERTLMNGANGTSSMRMLPGMQESLDAIPDATWEAPSHWEDTGPRPGRKGSYALPAAGDGEPADFSISALAGDAGGIPANVNRWRRQIGLPPWSPNEIRQESQSIPAGDKTGLRFFLAPPQPEPGDPAILAVIVSLPEVTWFFKVTGTVESIQSVEEDVDAFMESLEFAEEKP